MFGVIAAVAIASVGGLYVMGNALKDFQPGSNKIRKDLDALIGEMQPALDGLVPWTHKEMEMLSINITDAVYKNRMTKSGRGVLTSIYHEPMAVFAFKAYLSPKINEVYFVKTSHLEFFYRVRNKYVEVFLNGEKVGLIRDNSEIFDARGRTKLGFIDRTNLDDHIPVIVQGKELGRMLQIERADRVNERAFSFLQKMEPSDQAVFLAITLFDLISKRVKSNIK